MSFEKKAFEPLVEADYLVRMNRITEKTSKAGNKMLSIGFQVVNGDNKDRLIFENFLLDHKNPKVGEITADRLDKYLKAVGLETGLEGIDHDYSKLEEYTDIPFIATVKIQAGNNGYPDSNRIAAFKRR